jgi:hypothetical protein
MIDYTPKQPKEEPKFAGKYKRTFKQAPLVEPTHQRVTQKIASLVTPGGSTALKPIPKYTGDLMKGISIVHKSCLQPVFSDAEAVDFANMRR